MKDYLSVIITSPDGEHQWQGQGIAAPRLGDDITVRHNTDDVILFCGRVSNVHWQYRANMLGAVVSVWLEPIPA